MSYGKYTESEVVFEEYMGRDVLVRVPDRYSGLLQGKIYDPTGKEIKYGQSYFEQMAITSGLYYNTHTTLITKVINNYCKVYIKLYCTDKIYHSYESGFGGENDNGLISFTTAKPIRTPDTLFGINKELYTIKWDYSPTEPSSDAEEEPYEYD